MTIAKISSRGYYYTHILRKWFEVLFVMKKATKIIALLLVMVLMVSAFAACGSKSDSTTDDSTASDASSKSDKVELKILDTEYVIEDYAICIAKENSELLESVNSALEELIADGSVKTVTDYYISGEGELPEFQQNVADDAEVLTMATNAAFPPYEYVENDTVVGIDAVVAGLIADKLGMKLEISDMEFDAVIPSVVSGKADMGMAGLTVTEERLQSVSFTTSYATGIQSIIVRADSDITSADDIVAKIEAGEDIQIGTQNATTGFIYASDTIENGGFGEDHVQAFSKGADAVAALTSGKIDCVIIDNEPAKAFVAANNG